MEGRREEGRGRERGSKGERRRGVGVGGGIVQVIACWSMQDP